MAAAASPAAGGRRCGLAVTVAATLVIGLTGGLLAGCGGSAAGGAAAGAGGRGPVKVLYAGSLVNLMEHRVGPGFSAATGYSFQGQGAGSAELANAIKGRVKQGDVFISASPGVNTTLEGAGGGGWVSWYATFASAPLLIGYSPSSKFAAALRSKPWYQVITEPGFRLGRTDPKLDPKGKLTVQALQEAAAAYHYGALAAVARSSQVFPEEELVGRLESGQLDAGFFYRQEAAAQHIPVAGLGRVKLAATFTLTVLNRAPDRAAAIAFARYLLGSQGRALLAAAGLTPLPAVVRGNARAVPGQLRPLIPGAATR